MEKCPMKKIPNEFEEGMGNRTAIYIPFPQAVPRKATVDPEKCLWLTKGACKLCLEACPAEAIDFEQKPQEIEVNVGAIVVATGFDMLGKELHSKWGYQHKNVVNALEYERILCPTGPFGMRW